MFEALSQAQTLSGIGPCADGFPPRTVVQIPIDGVGEPAFEAFPWSPAQFRFGLAGVDRIASVVPGPSDRFIGPVATR